MSIGRTVAFLVAALTTAGGLYRFWLAYADRPMRGLCFEIVDRALDPARGVAWHVVSVRVSGPGVMYEPQLCAWWDDGRITELATTPVLKVGDDALRGRRHGEKRGDPVATG